MVSSEPRPRSRSDRRSIVDREGGVIVDQEVILVKINSRSRRGCYSSSSGDISVDQ